MTQSPRIFVLGALNADLVCHLPHIVAPGETIMAAEPQVFFGGKGGNQAVAAARMGASVGMIGAVGDDDHGAAMLANLQQNGVSTDLVQKMPCASGQAWIQIAADGENAIIVLPGANDQFDAQAAQPCDVFVSQMELGLPRVAPKLRDFHAQGAVTVLNMAPMPQDASVEEVVDCLLHTGHLVVNELEWAALQQLMRVEDSADLARAFDTVVIVTRGGDGAEMTSPDGTVTRSTATTVEVVDTTGAGDTFVGVYAAMLAKGRPPATALNRATRAASMACRALGAQSGMPREEDLDMMGAA